MELHILTFIEQCSGLQGRRRCLAAGVLDIWHGTDPPDLGTARHGTSLYIVWLFMLSIGYALEPDPRDVEAWRGLQAHSGGRRGISV